MWQCSLLPDSLGYCCFVLRFSKFFVREWTFLGVWCECVCEACHIFGILFNFNSTVNMPFVRFTRSKRRLCFWTSCGLVATKPIFLPLWYFPKVVFFRNLLHIRLFFALVVKSLWWAWFFIGYIVSNHFDFSLFLQYACGVCVCVFFFLHRLNPSPSK